METLRADTQNTVDQYPADPGIVDVAAQQEQAAPESSRFQWLRTTAARVALTLTAGIAPNVAAGIDAASASAPKPPAKAHTAAYKGSLGPRQVLKATENFFTHEYWDYSSFFPLNVSADSTEITLRENCSKDPYTPPIQEYIDRPTSVYESDCDGHKDSIGRKAVLGTNSGKMNDIALLEKIGTNTAQGAKIMKNGLPLPYGATERYSATTTQFKVDYARPSSTITKSAESIKEIIVSYNKKKKLVYTDSTYPKSS